MYVDLLRYYGTDLVEVVRGNGPAPLLVLAQVRGIPDTGVTYALVRGDRDSIGWGMDRALMADLYDALNQNTRATGNWSKKPPEIPPYKRPDSLSTERKPKTVAELHALYSRRK